MIRQSASLNRLHKPLVSNNYQSIPHKYISDERLLIIHSIDSIMQGEDTGEKSFEEQLTSIVLTFIKEYSDKLQGPAERKLILNSVSCLLRNEGRMYELIEYDISKSPAHSLSYASQSHEESEERPASSVHNQSKDASKAKINMIHPSEHYENSILQQGYSSSNSNSEVKEESEDRDMETKLIDPQAEKAKIAVVKRSLRRAEMERKRKELQEKRKMEAVKQQDECSDSIEEREADSSVTSEYLACLESTKKRQAEKKRKNGLSLQNSTLPPVPLPKGRKPIFPEMEKLIVPWIYSRVSLGIRVTQFDIRKKAIAIVNRLPRSKGKVFNASKGWMEKFFHRHSDILQLLSLQARKRPQAFVKEEEIEEE